MHSLKTSSCPIKFSVVTRQFKTFFYMTESNQNKRKLKVIKKLDFKNLNTPTYKIRNMKDTFWRASWADWHWRFLPGWERGSSTTQCRRRKLGNPGCSRHRFLGSLCSSCTCAHVNRQTNKPHIINTHYETK